VAQKREGLGGESSFPPVAGRLERRRPVFCAGLESIMSSHLRMHALIITGIRRGMNGLLYGPPGVGKTQILRDAVAELGLSMKYFSAPTLDPWADLVGIPVPLTVETDVGPRTRLTFVRPADVEDAEVIVVDELNRGHPKTQNAVMEMVQFRTINGTPLPKLRAVFAAINPSDGGRHVHELDPAMIDRFDLHFDVKAEPDETYFVDRLNMRPEVAAALVDWWRSDLTPEMRAIISPRRLEKIGHLHAAGLPLELAIPVNFKVPISSLEQKLRGAGVLPFPLTPDSMVRRQGELLGLLAGQHSAEVAMAISDKFWTWPQVVARVVPVFLSLPSDIQMALLDNQEIFKRLRTFSLTGDPNNQRTAVAELIARQLS
jgi:hypothetical protein